MFEKLSLVVRPVIVDFGAPFFRFEKPGELKQLWSLAKVSLSFWLN
jgi:hypothetical protein